MIGKTNAGASKTGAVKNSVITVTYPEGSDCTVSNGSRTFRALDTSGTAAFVVSVGTWTVKAVSGSDSASQNVTISSMNETKSVTLVYKLDLYNAGNQCTSVTGGWSAVGDASINYDSNGLLYASSDFKFSGCYTNNSLSLSNFSTLYVTFESSSGGKGYMQIISSAGNSNPGTVLVQGSIPAGAATRSLALGSVTSGRIRLCLNPSANFKAKKVWLES